MRGVFKMAEGTTGTQTTTEDEAAIRADIVNMQAAITDLKAKGENLFTAEINNIEEKIKTKEAQLKTETAETVQIAETEVTSWWDKHKSDIFNYAKIAALVYIAMRLTM